MLPESGPAIDMPLSGDPQRPYGQTVRPRDIMPSTSMTTKIIRKRKKRIFAMPAAAEAIPPNPNKAATTATIKKTTAQYNISQPPLEKRYHIDVPIILQDTCIRLCLGEATASHHRAGTP